jgi:cytochrome c553
MLPNSFFSSHSLLDTVRRNRFVLMFFLVLAAELLFAVFSFLPVVAADKQTVSTDPRLLSDLEPHYRESVSRGWRFFQTSFAQDGVACVHCHPRYDAMRLWAGAYPKVQVFDGTPYQVKGLREVVVEALEKHTDLLPYQRLELVEDLVAYIAWWADGIPIAPGHSRAFPPPEEDLAILQSSVDRGRRFISKDTFGFCRKCHSTEEEMKNKKIPLGQAASTFPRFIDPPGRVMPLESYLSWHIAEHGNGRKLPEESDVTDLAAYLASLAEGIRLHPGGWSRGQGGKGHE